MASVDGMPSFGSISAAAFWPLIYAKIILSGRAGVPAARCEASQGEKAFVTIVCDISYLLRRRINAINSSQPNIKIIA